MTVLREIVETCRGTDKHSCDTRKIQGGDEDECDNGNGCERLHGCSSVSEENAAERGETTVPCAHDSGKVCA